MELAQITLFSLIMMRMAGFIFLNPILGRRDIPSVVKAGLVFVLTVAVYSFSAEQAEEVSNTLVYAFLLLKEFAVGFAVGFVMELFFMVFSYGGYIIDYQLGLTMAAVFDPQSNAQMAVSGKLYQTYFSLLFFAVDGHLLLMKILLTSAEIVPYGGVLITQNLSARMIEIFLQCMELSIRFAMPILVGEFLIEAGMGILNKVVPQISIFVVNIQVKIIVGFGLLLILFLPMSEFLENMLSEMMKTIQGILTFL